MRNNRTMTRLLPLELKFSAIDIPGLASRTFNSCAKLETRLRENVTKERLKERYESTPFSTNLFHPYYIDADVRWNNTFVKSPNPIAFSVAPAKTGRMSLAEWKYFTLLKLLRDETKSDLRLLLLARWLQDEDICKPKELLPKDVLDRAARLYRQSMRISVSDDLYLSLVKTWEPYFILLRSDLKKIKSKGNDAKGVLEKAGFDPIAVNLILERKNIRSVIVLWVSARTHTSPHVIQNALSRKHTARWRS
jgi:hypothetical protein